MHNVQMVATADPNQIMRKRMPRTLPSTTIATQLREAIAAMDAAHVVRDEDRYRSASQRAFQVALALTEARGFVQVVERLNR